jgi:hypothetical protein
MLWRYRWNVLTAHSLMVGLVYHRCSGCKMLNWLLSLRIHLLIAYTLILVDQRCHTNTWTVKVRTDSTLFNSLIEFALLWWWPTSCSCWSSYTSHLNILFLSCFMMFQDNLIHRTMYCNMWLSTVICPSPCQEATFPTSSSLNPITLDLWWLLVQVILITMLAAIFAWHHWLIINLQIVLFNSIIFS